MHYNTTLCYIEHNHHVLMMLRNKKKNDPNAGKWIGVGGKLENDESIHNGMIREVKEETGYDVLEYQYRGIVDFFSDIYASETMHLFVVTKFSGSLKSCDEGSLAWISYDELSSLPMWQGDQIFIELIRNPSPFFHLTLRYEEAKLIEAKLDGRLLDISQLK